MAGVTDRPFRQLCRQLGAGVTVSEMVSANPALWNSRKSKMRRDHDGEPGPIVCQIAGGDVEWLVQAAQMNVAHGAQIIDINMGCPAKKVCNKAAGSALLRDEALVAEMLQATVAAVDVPVTLKFRTGWDRDNRNGMTIAKIAEQAGIQMLSVHGRTRADKYMGNAEYDTIAAIKQAVSIPVIANGDITNGAKAKYVLDYTQADGVMIGRAAQGNPWIFGQIQHFLTTGEEAPLPSAQETRDVLVEHIKALHSFYGELAGVRIARKHLGWYLKSHAEGEATRRAFNQLEDPSAQLALIEAYFEPLIRQEIAA